MKNVRSTSFNSESLQGKDSENKKILKNPAV
jgi:hypothetical protein